jgi:hypothetical protein
VQKKKKIETEKYRCQMEENITLRTNKYWNKPLKNRKNTLKHTK